MDGTATRDGSLAAVSGKLKQQTGTENRRICRCQDGRERTEVMVTDNQRISQLEEKVEALDRSVADLRRSVAGLNSLIDEMRLEHLRELARSRGLAFADHD